MLSSFWSAIAPDRARTLTDARRQLHHAAQLAAAFGISYLPPRPDDSHTNLEWLPALVALASNPVSTGGSELRVAVRAEPLSLLLLRGLVPMAERLLAGDTMGDASGWLARQLGTAGLAPNRWTLERHYQIPPHAVGAGAAFDARAEDLRELGRWLANGAALLEAVRASSADASAVRCWPHHFDIATLLVPGPGTSVGVGLEPGDAYYDEPYFYVNAHPQPRVEALPKSLAGGGSWHTHEWIGAVLPGSRLSGNAPAQQHQAAAFIESAVTACRALVTRS